MNTFESRLAQVLQSKIAFLLIASFLLWTMGVPALLNHAKAAQLTNVSDTLSTSNLSAASKHTIQFQVSNTITPSLGSQSLSISLIPSSGSFSEAFSAATTSDIFIATSTGAGNYPNNSSYAVVTTCTSGNQVTLSTAYNGGSPDSLTFNFCSGSQTVIATSTYVTITIGSSTPLWTNPAVAGSERIVIGGNNQNTGETRVAVLSAVTLTASINTSFTFTVSGLATSSSVGAITTTGSTTATSLPFGTLASSTGAVILGQTLQVSTNAKNGFVVTVQANQPPTSATGAIINYFSNGASTTNPIAWVAPTATLDVPSTYSHFGVTSDDTDLAGAANAFSNGTLWSGDFYHARTLFTHNGPADGSTQNKGLAHVAYKIQVSDLQAAGNDYTDTLTYVATPTF